MAFLFFSITSANAIECYLRCRRFRNARINLWAYTISDVETLPIVSKCWSVGELDSSISWLSLTSLPSARVNKVNPWHLAPSEISPSFSLSHMLVLLPTIANMTLCFLCLGALKNTFSTVHCRAEAMADGPSSWWTDSWICFFIKSLLLYVTRSNSKATGVWFLSGRKPLGACCTSATLMPPYDSFGCEETTNWSNMLLTKSLALWNSSLLTLWELSMM